MKYITVTKNVKDIKIGDSIVIGRKRPIFVRAIVSDEERLSKISRSGKIMFQTIKCKNLTLPNVGEYQVLEPNKPLFLSEHRNFGIVAEGDFDYYQ
jgi:hypothetical protein